MTSGLDVFDSTFEKTNLIFKRIETELGWEGHRHQSYQVTRVILHALRDRLSVEEAANFSAQLPMLLRGVFYEGWKPERVPVKMSQEEFIDHVRNEVFLDLAIPVSELVRIVLGSVFAAMDHEESQKIMSRLPADFRQIFPGNKAE